MTIAWRHKPLAGSKPRMWEDRRAFECAFPFDGPDDSILSCCEPTVSDKPHCRSHIDVMYYPNSPVRKVEGPFNPRAAGASLSKEGATRHHRRDGLPVRRLVKS